MENTERFITSLEDALIAARQKVVEVESCLARMRAVSGTGQDARYYHIRALEMWEKAERLKAERDAVIERIMVADCPYESCLEKPKGIIGCDACWRDWSAKEAARRRQVKSVSTVPLDFWSTP